MSLSARGVIIPSNISCDGLTYLLQQKKKRRRVTCEMVCPLIRGIFRLQLWKWLVLYLIVSYLRSKALLYLPANCFFVANPDSLDYFLACRLPRPDYFSAFHLHKPLLGTDYSLICCLPCLDYFIALCLP